MLARTLAPAQRPACAHRAVQRPRKCLTVCASLQGRPVALPSGTLWLLDPLQSQYYSVHGTGFIIPRVEEVEQMGGQAVARARFVRNKQLPALRPTPKQPSTASLIHQAVNMQPTALTLLSDVLIEADVEVAPEFSTDPTNAARAAPAPAPSTCTGIVHVPSESTSTEVRAMTAPGGYTCLIKSLADLRP